MYEITLSPEQVSKIQIYESRQEQRSVADDPAAVYELIKHYAEQDQEHFILVLLDGANAVKDIQTITKGTATASLVHPREVFKPAILAGAISVIVAHNHPSGNLRASAADTDVTQRLQEVGNLVGIQLIDHLIITKSSYRSII